MASKLSMFWIDTVSKVLMVNTIVTVSEVLNLIVCKSQKRQCKENCEKGGLHFSLLVVLRADSPGQQVRGIKALDKTISSKLGTIQYCMEQPLQKDHCTSFTVFS